jgi:threonine/homoserine/homoserine lactone efflux protein
MAVSTTAMAHGSRPSALLGLGLAVGLAFWGVVAAAGLGAVLMQSALGLALLRGFGAAYLLWLAWQSARRAWSMAPDAGADEAAPHAPPSRQLAHGLLLNFSNPKAVMAWVSVLALGLPSADSGAALWVNTGLCAVLGLFIYLGYALAFSRAAVRSAYRTWQRVIEGLAAAVFAWSGMRMLLARADP